MSRKVTKPKTFLPEAATVRELCMIDVGLRLFIRRAEKVKELQSTECALKFGNEMPVRNYY
jgi:hypothetical protein